MHGFLSFWSYRTKNQIPLALWQLFRIHSRIAADFFIGSAGLILSVRDVYLCRMEGFSACCARKYYQITPKGVETLSQLRQEWDALVSKVASLF